MKETLRLSQINGRLILCWRHLLNIQYRFVIKPDLTLTSADHTSRWYRLPVPMLSYLYRHRHFHLPQKRSGSWQTGGVLQLIIISLSREVGCELECAASTRPDSPVTFSRQKRIGLVIALWNSTLLMLCWALLFFCLFLPLLHLQSWLSAQAHSSQPTSG